MLPMKADLQELMITEGEIRKIVGKFSSPESDLFFAALFAAGFISFCVASLFPRHLGSLTIMLIFILIFILISSLFMYFIILDKKIGS